MNHRIQNSLRNLYYIVESRKKLLMLFECISLVFETQQVKIKRMSEKHRYSINIVTYLKRNRVPMLLDLAIWLPLSAIVFKIVEIESGQESVTLLSILN